MLDQYSDRDINDAEDFGEMDHAARRTAEMKMAARDRREQAGGRRGVRASRRSQMQFLDSDGPDMDMDDEDALAGGVSRMKRRTRRQYDERRDVDDLDGMDDEIPLEQLSDIKAKSIIEWIANERVRRSIIKHFRQFLMTYVDEHGASVYGERIRNLGESKHLTSQIFWKPSNALLQPMPSPSKFPISISHFPNPSWHTFSPTRLPKC